MNSKDHFLARHFTCVSDTVFFFCGIIMLASEIWKQLVLTFIVGNGTYIWWYFPFQLCSIPMYVLLVYPWLGRGIPQSSALTFLMCYCLLGGIAVFADTSGLHYPLARLTLHSYLWHILLITLGVGAGCVYLHRIFKENRRTLFSHAFTRAFPLRPFLFSTLFYIICCLIAECLNLSLDRYGIINMFYINPDYKMQQIVFRDLIPAFGNTAAILVYIAATILGASLLFLVWDLIFRFTLRFRKRRTH